MYISGVADKLLRLLVPLAGVLTTYLYLYPAFHACAFPATNASTITSFTETLQRHWPFDAHVPSIPFRLLVLADPQLEGDSSLPKPEDGLLPQLRRRWTTLCAGEAQDILPLVVESLRVVWLEDIPESLRALRKRLDLFGNDYYLGHVYRTMHWWTAPTHVAVLGDLIGSQWVTDDEFEWRGWRYWNRVFANGQRIGDEITILDNQEEERSFNMDDPSWAKNVINVAGNHDVGYAGEISENRMERFERVFGKANWDVRFRYPQGNVTGVPDRTDECPSLHLIVLNSLILDTPALSEDLQAQTYDYLNSLISHRLRPVEDRSSFTLLLTHLPLHKPEGVCVDAPFMDYWADDDGGGVYRPRGLKEQNHLSEQVSRQGTLEAVFGMSGNLNAPAHGKGRQGLIMTGHDHEGCDVGHFIPSDSTWSEDNEDDRETQWDVRRWKQRDESNCHTGIREITLRSMMGDYGGNAGLLSAWFDFEKGEWKYDIATCQLNLKAWWAVHVIDLVVLIVSVFSLVGHIFMSAGTSKTDDGFVASKPPPSAKTKDSKPHK